MFRFACLAEWDEGIGTVTVDAEEVVSGEVGEVGLFFFVFVTNGDLRTFHHLLLIFI